MENFTPKPAEAPPRSPVERWMMSPLMAAAVQWVEQPDGRIRIEFLARTGQVFADLVLHADTAPKFAQGLADKANALEAKRQQKEES